MNESVACCGLFCESCGVYIATEKDPVELERIALKMGTSPSEMPCKGCRSELLSPHCRDCYFRSCTQKRGLVNCEECSDYPCAGLLDFQTKMPHRAELFASAKYLKEYGLEAWHDKMIADYSCAECGEINSPYYEKCRKCGHKPVNSFAERNAGLFGK